jgi:hypothetical protein
MFGVSESKTWFSTIKDRSCPDSRRDQDDRVDLPSPLENFEVINGYNIIFFFN